MWPQRRILRSLQTEPSAAAFRAHCTLAPVLYTNRILTRDLIEILPSVYVKVCR